ncbi:MAG: pyridoxal phosphate-dependent aminotransferase family protein, partial [Boseongicola sp.]|nr:pyridoxal phosphate-dependent aminotransferase family protein [Boseongicola sp.]
MPQKDDTSNATQRVKLLGSLRKSYGSSRPKLEDRPARKKDRASSFDFSRHAAYSEVRIARAAAETLSLASPFFRVSEGVRGTEVMISGRWVTNFASYDYLSLNQSSAVCQAVKDDVDDWGVSATASRLVGGERKGHADLEKRLADFVGTESTLTMVSGHATNLAVIRTLLGAGDLILVDALAHNSIYEGIRASGASHVTFPHNDYDWVDQYLTTNGARYENTLIAVEGLYSMDGDTPDLPKFVEIKQRHEAWLMVDEAHSLGVLGANGKGICEESGVDPRQIEVIMGT